MANIKAGVKYILTNPLIGNTNALASTSANDSVIVVPLKTDGSQKWYIIETSTVGYYRLHTEQKGDFAALDVFNYNGKNTIDLHMYSVQENTGQYWHFNLQDDGSVKIYNQFTGPDMYLDVAKDTLQPTLTARDGSGQRWTLSEVGSSKSTATPSSSISTMAASVTRSTITPTVTTTTTSSSNTATASSDSSSTSLSKGAIAGIAVGGAAVLMGLLLGALLLLRRRRRRAGRESVLQNPPAITSRPLLRIPEARQQGV